MSAKRHGVKDPGRGGSSFDSVEVRLFFDTHCLCQGELGTASYPTKMDDSLRKRGPETRMDLCLDSRVNFDFGLP